MATTCNFGQVKDLRLKSLCMGSTLVIDSERNANFRDVTSKNSTVRKDLMVGGDTFIEGSTIIEKELDVTGNISITENSTVCGNMLVKGILNLENNSITSGNSTVFGDLIVKGNIFGNIFGLDTINYTDLEDINCGNIGNVQALFVDQLFGKNSPINVEDELNITTNGTRITFEDNIQIGKTGFVGGTGMLIGDRARGPGTSIGYYGWTNTNFWGEPESGVAIGNYCFATSSSVSIGYRCLWYGTTSYGYKGVTIGSWAGFQGRNADSVNIGYKAGYYNDTERCVNVGSGAGKYNYQFQCVAIGQYAMGGNYISSAIHDHDVAIGGFALASRGRTRWNIVMGYEAGYSLGFGISPPNFSQSNVLIGDECARLTTNLNESVAIGARCNISNASHKSVLIGSRSATIQPYATSIGYSSQCTAPYSLAIGYNSACGVQDGIALGNAAVVSSTSRPLALVVNSDGVVDSAPPAVNARLQITINGENYLIHLTKA